MTDWKALAKARELEIPAEQMEPLVKLEEAFRPLVKRLTPDMEPAIGMVGWEEEA